VGRTCVRDACVRLLRRGAVAPLAAAAVLACAASGPFDGEPAATSRSEVGVVSVRVVEPVALGSPLRFAVVNRTVRSVFAEDQKSGCSILLLESEHAAGWKPLLGCNLERKAAVVELRPGETREGDINPWSTHFDRPPGSRDPAFGPGRYRFRFS